MCGICGMMSVGAPPEIGTIRSMMATLSHRGPDGSGYYRDRRVALGHTRLAIIDAAGGAQPMANEDNRVWVTFNGEIFNYVELRNELAGRGHVFRTRSDTEVIVHAWEEWGLDCFARFNGQWALAIWDRRTAQLVLSRDPFGILPLYYTQLDDRLLFASEVAALFADPGVDRAFDPDGIAETFTFWSARAPTTVFRGISQVRPGTSLVVRSGSVTEYAHWSDQFPSEPDDVRGSVEESAGVLREALVEATRLRFTRSEVPVASYLSGGIDSAVTAGIIRRHSGADLQTYSLRFADAEYDEGGFQRLVSAQLGTEHHDITVTGGDIASAFPEAVRHAQAPILRSGPVPMLLLSRFVRERGHRVVVTGEGADEMLAGYDIFREAAVRRFWARDPDSPVRSEVVAQLYPWMKHSPNKAPAFARGFFGRNLDPDDPFSSHRPRWDASSALRGMLSRDVADAITADPVGGLFSQMPTAARAWHPLSRAQWIELTTLLPGYVLASQGDRMLMANSVEGRFPFLDPDVARVAASIPPRHKLMGLDEKHVLKRAFRDLVPREVLSRPKQPYRAPDSRSFFGSAPPEWVGEVVSTEAVQEARIFDPVIVRMLIEKCARRGARPLGNSDNMRLIAVLSTQLLHRDLIARQDVKYPLGDFVAIHDEIEEMEVR